MSANCLNTNKITNNANLSHMQNHRGVGTGDEVAWVVPHSAFDLVYVPILNQLPKLHQLLSFWAFEC